MATESLIVELDARTQKIDAKLTATEKKLAIVEKGTKKADKAFLGLSKAGDVAAESVTKLATAGTAAAAAIGLAVNQAIEFNIELTKAASRADVSIEKMQGLAFATKTVGIDLEKLGDISKDTREKVGDFLNTGGGGFQDFADALKLTADETQTLALRFKDLSGPEILQQMVNMMQEAEISAVQMSHALEGMASDTTDLIPLLIDNGKELERLEGRYNDLGVTITKIDSEKIKALSEETSIFAATVEGSMTKATAVLSDEISGILKTFAGLSKDIGSVVVTAVTGYQFLIQKATASVFNLFREAEIASLEAAISIKQTFGAEAIDAVAGLDKAINDFVVSATDGLVDLGTVDFLQDATQPIDELQAKLNELVESDAMREAFDVSFLEEQWQAAVDKIAEYNEVVAETVEAEKPSVGVTEEDVDNTQKNVKQIAEELKVNEKNEKSSEKQKEKLRKDGLKAASAINSALFEDNKAIKAGIIIADTAQNVVTSVANSGGVPFGIPAGIAAAAMGVSQLAALDGASPGGGGISAPTGTSVPTETVEPDFEPELATLDLSEQTEAGATSSTVKFDADASDELGQALANYMNKARVNS